MAGGSSGGSAAAVAAGMVPLAMGSDTGGSIRIPASLCGPVGLKPSFGRVSRYGELPLDYSLGHLGPITRSVRDAALALEAVAGYDPRDPSSKRRPVPRFAVEEEVSLAGLRLGVIQTAGMGPAGAEAAEALRRMAGVAEDLGARLESVALSQIRELNDAGRTILLAEAAAILGPHLARRGDIGPDVVALVDQGRQLPATSYIQAQFLRRRLAREFQAVWRQADCLLLPATPTTAPEIGRTTLEWGGAPVDLRVATTYFTRPFNVLGLPALSLPVGLSSEGLPLAIQIVGKPFDEATVLRVAAALEDATGFTRVAPPVGS
jgi:aspartyl-tRNA(Asn)/glutamyl-tRNA(Gln) amidotransferase subunit A